MLQLFDVEFSEENSIDRYANPEESFYVVAENINQAIEKANEHFKNVLLPKSQKELAKAKKKKDFDADDYADLTKYVMTKISLEHKAVIV